MISAILATAFAIFSSEQNIGLHAGYSVPNSIIGISYQRAELVSNIGIKGISLSSSGMATYSPGISMGWTIPNSSATVMLTGTMHYFVPEKENQEIILESTFGQSPAIKEGLNPGEITLSASYRIGNKYGLNLDAGIATAMKEPLQSLNIHAGISADIVWKLTGK
jgi:hypothetical protein